MSKKLKSADGNKENKEEAEEVKKIVTDVEAVKNALQTVLNFQNEYKINLIIPKGIKKFKEIYDRFSKDNKLRQFVIDEVGKQITPVKQFVIDEVGKQITPVNQKIDQLMQMVQSIFEQRKRKSEKEQEPKITDEEISFSQ